MGIQNKMPKRWKRKGDKTSDQTVIVTVLILLMFLIAQMLSLSEAVRAEGVLNQENTPQDNNQDTVYAQPAAANTETAIDGLKYSLDNSTRQATILGNVSREGVIKIPEKVSYGGIDYSVVKIGNGAFSISNANTSSQNTANQKITGFVFENGQEVLEDIGVSAFYGGRNYTEQLDLPHSVKTIGAEALRSTSFSSLTHKKVAGLRDEISLPALAGSRPALQPEEELWNQGYESIVDSSQGNVSLRKSAKWTNEDLTEAEILIEYGENEQIVVNMDFIFVMDYSGSMSTPATATALDDKQQYSYPRSFYMEDIVRDTAKAVLGDGVSPNNNRVGLVAFGGVDGSAHNMGSLLWTEDFTKNSQDIDAALTTHPLLNDNTTDYTAGIKGAAQLIEKRDQQTNSAYKNRKTVIFFLSDGKPLPESANGVAEANALKAKGADIFSIAMYTDKNSYLRQLSSNGTVYDASDTEKFEEAVKQALLEAVENAAVDGEQVEDVLSEHFTLQTDTSADVTVSPGGGMADAFNKKVTWNLNGCQTGVVHTLTARVKLEPGTELEASGLLPTNQSLEVINKGIAAETQPELERYLVTYAFVNGADPGGALPEEVMALLPETEGGFRDMTQVRPQSVAETPITTADGEVWIFKGWDKDEVTINKENVHYVGNWIRPQVNFEFTKVDGSEAGTPLGGVEFSLYECNLKDDPSHTHNDSMVTGQAGDCWELKEIRTSDGDTGKVRFENLNIEQYMLVETKAAEGYMLPHGQWLITVDTDNNIEIKGKGASLPPAFALKTDEQGNTVYELPNYKVESLPLTGGLGVILLMTGGIALMGIAIVKLVMTRKQ